MCARSILIALLFSLCLALVCTAKPSFPTDKTLGAYIGAGISAYDTNQFAFDPRIGFVYSMPMFYENIRFEAILDLSPRYFFAPKYTYYNLDSLPLASKSYLYQTENLGGIQAVLGIVPVMHFRKFYFGIAPVIQYNYVNRSYEKRTYDLVSRAMTGDTSFVNTRTFSSVPLYLTVGIENGPFRFAIVGEGSSIYATFGIVFLHKPMTKMKLVKIPWE
jgi:hypothetical protein